MVPRTVAYTLIATLQSVVHVPPACRSERRIVETLQSQSILYILFEGVKRAKLLRRRWKAASARSFKEHLVAAAEQGRNLIANEDSRLLDVGLVLAFVSDHRANAVLGDFYPAVGQ